jgi:Arc/MetJ-type ribon-helix-helix transcriptional regulator
MRSGTAAKAKISVTVDAGVVAQIDRGVRARRYRSRSAAIEAALEQWARVERRRERDAEIEAYYVGMTAAERDEDRRWAELGATALGEVERADEKHAPPSKPRRRGRR